MRGHLGEDDVASALAEQRRTKRRLGQILVARGFISPATLDSTLAEQAGHLEPERGFGGGLREAIGHRRAERQASAPHRAPLGEVLIRHGHLTGDDLTSALAEQARSGKLIGEILIERGKVSRPAVNRALETQRAREMETEHGFGSGLRDAIARGSTA
jgi:hypothetical protein